MSLSESGLVRCGSGIQFCLNVCPNRPLVRWKSSVRFLRMRISSYCVGFKVDRLPSLLHEIRITDQLLQAQESLGSAVPCVLAIPTLGSGSAKTNPEAAPSQRQTSRARRDAVLSWIGATPTRQTDGTGSPSPTGQPSPSASGSTTPQTYASLERNDGRTTPPSSLARAFETLSLLPSRSCSRPRCRKGTKASRS